MRKNDIKDLAMGNQISTGRNLALGKEQFEFPPLATLFFPLTFNPNHKAQHRADETQMNVKYTGFVWLGD